MTRRKWRIRRTMVVPAQWQGSVEHFYHFFFGYFMPTVLWQNRTEATAFTVRDCGPMNPWFDLLEAGTDLEFMPPGVMLQRVLTRRQEMQILRGWDDPTQFDPRHIRSFSSVVKNRVLKGLHTENNGPPRITILDRRQSPDFYLKKASETYSSGAEWRSLPNISDLVSELAPLGEVTLIDTAAMTPAEQVRALASTSLLVAQHGAGLSNMVWMPEGSAVLEIQPPLPPTIDQIFSNLASCCSLDHLVVRQSGEHSPIDAAQVVKVAESLLTQPGAFIPKMTGNSAVRFLRRKLRRI